MYFLLSVTEVIFDAIRSLCLFLDIIIYDLIIVMYKIFEKLAVAEFLDNNTIQGIYQKVGLILGLFMIFRLTFSLVKMLIDPDLISDKEKGVVNIVKRIVISIFLLAITPFLFDEAFEIQRIIVTDNIIGKVIMGVDNPNTGDYGRILSENVFFAFFKDEVDPPVSIDPGLTSLKNRVPSEGFDITIEYVNNTETIGGYTVEFETIISVLVGIFILWVIVIYCFAVGRRVIQLAFLQLIAPIPILSYVSDKKETAFSNWLKQCFATYIDLFIRLAIIYFVMYVVSVLAPALANSSLPTLTDSTGLDSTDPLFVPVVIIIICGLLLFAKVAPEIIGELFPGLKTKASIGYGIGFDSVGAHGFGGLIGAAASGILGFTTGRGLGRLTGALSGTARGIMSGGEKGNALRNAFNSAKKQVEANEAKIERQRGSWFGGRFAELGHRLGLPFSYLDAQESRIDELDKQSAKEKFSADTYGLIGKRFSSMKSIAEDELLNGNLSGTSLAGVQSNLLYLKADMEAAQNSGNPNHYAKAVVRYNQGLKEAKELFIDEAIKDKNISGKFNSEYAGLINDVTNNLDDFQKIEINTSSFDSFSSIKASEEKATGEAQKHIFAQSGYDTEKSRITSNPKYKRAKANRTAVGGKSKK